MMKIVDLEPLELGQVLGVEAVLHRRRVEAVLLGDSPSSPGDGCTTSSQVNWRVARC